MSPLEILQGRLMGLFGLAPTNLETKQLSVELYRRSEKAKMAINGKEGLTSKPLAILSFL